MAVPPVVVPVVDGIPAVLPCPSAWPASGNPSIIPSIGMPSERSSAADATLAKAARRKLCSCSMCHVLLVFWALLFFERQRDGIDLYSICYLLHCHY